MKELFKGTALRVRARFLDEYGNLYDPDTVRVRFKAPDGTEVVHSYPGSQDLVREGLGVYRSDVELSAVGVWTVRFEADGPVKVASEAQVRAVSYGWA